MEGQEKRIFVTGATGYVGGRLVPRLLDAGYTVRCYARSPRKLDQRTWRSHPGIEVVEGDLDTSPIADIAAAMAGCDFAYYLVHSMLAAGSEYASRDQKMADHFATAAEQAGVKRIIYLGGLGETGEDLSEHLSSRLDVGSALRDGNVPVTELRAAMIIGSGSASFEILRYLVERLPAMITPKWVRTECQPIAIRNVLEYLEDCLTVPETSGEIIDIGGPDIMTYHEIMKVMADVRGLPKRLIIPVPVLTPKLSSAWIHLITPLSSDIARPLAEGLRNRVVCRDDKAQTLMPQNLISVRESIRLALDRIEHNDVETSWSTAGTIPGDPDWAGGTVFIDERSTTIDAPPATVFRAVCRIGGGNGWYAADWLWRLRGFMDQLVGGPGLRRGRRDPERIEYGDALDFWRVTGLKPAERLSLRAEMKVPGEALLEFNLTPSSDSNQTTLTQTARFLPKGLFGLVYWYAVLPFHNIVFRGMLRGIEDSAEAEARG